jgi:ubiquinone/menaquinone biosynthesis C-methylase UbiE
VVHAAASIEERTLAASRRVRYHRGMNPLATPDAWNLVAAGYAAEIEHVMRPISRAVIALADARAPGIVDRARLLDVACGPGTLALELSPRATQVQALDFSPAMLEQLRAEMRRRAVTNIVPVHGDGMALPYGDERFAAAFSVFGLMFFPDRSQGFAELHRVLRPGGVAIVTSWAPIDLSPLMTLSFAA